jgi:hypothetical protein
MVPFGKQQEVLRDLSTSSPEDLSETAGRLFIEGGVVVITNEKPGRCPGFQGICGTDGRTPSRNHCRPNRTPVSFLSFSRPRNSWSGPPGIGRSPLIVALSIPQTNASRKLPRAGAITQVVSVYSQLTSPSSSSFSASTMDARGTAGYRHIRSGSRFHPGPSAIVTETHRSTVTR